MLRLKLTHLLLALMAVAIAWPTLAADAAAKGKKAGAHVVVLDNDLEKAGQDIDDVEEIEIGDESGPLVWVMAGRGFLGVTPMELTPELREHFGVAKEAGVMIGRVEPDSPAAKAGLKVGDIVTKVDGKDVDSPFALQKAIRGKKANETVSLEVWRDRRKETLTATVTERDREQLDVSQLLLGHPGLKLGGDKDILLRFQPEKLERMTKGLQERLDSPEFKDRIRRSMDLEKQMQEMERKFQDMEKKLQEMEKKLKERSASTKPASQT